jgi:hypothetical protein
MYYWKPGYTVVSAPTAQTGTMSAGTLGTWSSFGFKEVDAINLPGLYEVGMPDILFSTNVNHVVAMIKGTGITPVLLEYDLVQYDPLDAVRLGLTALPNTACTTNASLITSGTGTAQLSVASGLVTLAGVTHTGAVIPTVTTVSNRVSANTDQWNGVAVTGMPMPTFTYTTPLTSGQTASAVWDALLASYTTANTFGARVVRSSTASITNDVTTNALGHIAANVHQMQNNVVTAAAIATDAIDADALATNAVNEIVAATWALDITGNLIPTSGYWLYQAGLNSQIMVSDTAYINSSVYQQAVADALLNRNVGGGSNTGRLVKEALYALRNKSEISVSTLNVYNNDDSAIAWTATVSSSATADPVTGIDPP